MRAKMWRKLGYKTILRLGRVFLYNPRSGRLVYTDIDGGHWLEYNILTKDPWHKVKDGINGLPSQTKDYFLNTLVVCYCDSGCDICDFCAGVRLAPDRKTQQCGVCGRTKREYPCMDLNDGICPHCLGDMEDAAHWLHQQNSSK